MPRNIGTGSVNYLNQLDLIAKIILNQLLSKFTLHEGIGRDLPDHTASESLRISSSSQLEETLREGNR